MFEQNSWQQLEEQAPAAVDAIEAAREPAGPDGLVEQVYGLLHEVIDPEVGVNIVDLGLVFDVTPVGRQINVRMTLTTPGCPLGGYIDDSIRRTVTRLPEVDDTFMELVWEPAWGPQMMTDAAKRQLGWTR